MIGMLPDAVEREREFLLDASVNLLRKQGFAGFEVLDLPGNTRPEPLTIPVLNVRMRPDIRAVHETEGLLLGVVEPQSDLGEQACGRRWQGLAGWAADRGGQIRVFVQEEDRNRIRDIARHWHLDAGIIDAGAQALRDTSKRRRSLPSVTERYGR